MILSSRRDFRGTVRDVNSLTGAQIKDTFTHINIQRTFFLRPQGFVTHSQLRNLSKERTSGRLGLWVNSSLSSQAYIASQSSEVVLVQHIL